MTLHHKEVSMCVCVCAYICIYVQIVRTQAEGAVGLR